MKPFTIKTYIQCWITLNLLICSHIFLTNSLKLEISRSFNNENEESLESLVNDIPNEETSKKDLSLDELAGSFIEKIVDKQITNKKASAAPSMVPVDQRSLSLQKKLEAYVKQPDVRVYDYRVINQSESNTSNDLLMKFFSSIGYLKISGSAGKR